jgi:hypothetical protein
MIFIFGIERTEQKLILSLKIHFYKGLPLHLGHFLRMKNLFLVLDQTKTKVIGWH